MNKYITGAVIAAIGATFIGGVNVNIGLGTDYVKVMNPYQITTKFQFFGEHYDVNLGDELQGAEVIQPVLTLLQNASSFDTITFHIKGSGGSVDSMLDLLNSMASTKASILLSVEGNASSAYATLATSGYPLVMSKHSFLMFHMGSINGIDCSAQTGMFDGIPASVSCQNMKDAYWAELKYLFMHNEVLTSDEKDSLLKGNEVYLTSEEVLKRIS